MSKPNTPRSLAPVRWCAVAVAVASAAVHVLVLTTGGTPSSVQVVALLGMAAACLPCAAHLALLPRRRTWVQTAGVSAAMLVAHPLVSAGAGHSGHGGTGAVGIAMVVVPALGLALALTGLALGRCRPTAA
ncbi:hypothetical protein ACI782_24370 [Geodermatophilus sp. SYSU D00703]